MFNKSLSNITMVCLFAFSAEMLAQTNAGQITGSIVDQQSGALPGVKILAINLDTNIQQSTVSSHAGIYSLPALEPGRYRLTAELAGFNKLIKEPILVATSKVTSIDLQLSVGDTKVEVTVTGEAPLVQQANATVQYGINQKALDELPVSNQSALQVLSLVPGVLGDAGGEQAAVTTGFVTPGGGISVSGGRMGSTNYELGHRGRSITKWRQASGTLHFRLFHPSYLPLQLQLGFTGRQRKMAAGQHSHLGESNHRQLEDNRYRISPKWIADSNGHRKYRGLP